MCVFMFQKRREHSPPSVTAIQQAITALADCGGSSGEFSEFNLRGPCGGLLFRAKTGEFNRRIPDKRMES